MAFPRTLPPNRVSALWLPTGLRSKAHTGRIQVRNTTQVGWIWQETWDLLNVKTKSDMALLAYITNAFNRQVIFDIDHLLSPGSGLARNGAGTPAGSITVNGASQTGSTISTAGWPISTTGVVAAGDTISIENRLYQVSADADSNGTGICAIPVTPNVFKSPANGATVTITGATVRAMIWELPRFPVNRAPSYYTLTVGFMEVIP